MSSTSSCLLHVFVSQNIHIKRSPNGIKMDGELFWNVCEFWEVKSTRDGARGGHKARGHAPGGQVCPGPSWAPRKAVAIILLPQERYFLEKKSWQRFQSNRSYGSLDIKETVKGQNPKHRNRETHRDKSNLGGAFAPPMPWKPRTRGETLLPSREKVK